jgi:hypothetical protein
MISFRRSKSSVLVLLTVIVLLGTLFWAKSRRSRAEVEAEALGMSFTSTELPASKSEVLARLERGLTEEEVYRAIGKPFRHEFVVRRDGKTYHAVSYAFERRSLNYYVLFEEGRVIKVIEPPEFARHLEPMPSGTTKIEVLGLINPFHRVDQVFVARDLSGSQLDVNARLPKPSKGGSNLGPLILVAPLLMPSEGQQRETLRHNREREAHFDPARVSLGMGEGDVQAIYGPHIGERTESGVRCRAYGQWDEESPRQLWHHRTPEFRFSWVVVCFDVGKATAIFSDHFVDERWFLDFAVTRPVVDGPSAS